LHVAFLSTCWLGVLFWKERVWFFVANAYFFSRLPERKSFLVFLDGFFEVFFVDFWSFGAFMRLFYWILERFLDLKSKI
jgi:hypothetical protein